MEGGHRKMSETIVSKVVELRFDNKDFEANTRTTMSTLDKLKEKLHFYMRIKFYNIFN